MKTYVALLLIFLLLVQALPALADAGQQEILMEYQAAHNDYKGGRIEQAIQRLEKIIALDPTFVPAMNDLGCIYLETGYSAKAVELFNRGLGIRPQDRTLLVNLGRAYEMTGSSDNAAAAYEKALAVDPSTHSARRQLCNLYLKMGRIEAALEQAQRLTTLDPDSLKNRKLLIQCYAAKGDRDRAREECRRVLAINPSNQEIKNLMDSLGPGSGGGSSADRGRPGNNAALLIFAGIVGIIGACGIMVYYLKREHPAAAPAPPAARVEPYPEPPPLPSEPESFPTTRMVAPPSRTERAQPPLPPPRRVSEPPPAAKAPAREEATECWKLHKCSEDMRKTCVVYLEGLNCWSYEKTPCCSKDRALCVLCPYYSYRLQKAQKGAPTGYQQFEIKESTAPLLESLSNPQMSMLREISEIVGSTNEPEEMGRLFLEKMGDAVLCGKGALFMVDRDGEHLALTSTYHMSFASLNAGVVDFSPLIIRWVQENQFPMTMQKARRDRNWSKFFPIEVEKELFEHFELLIPLMEEKAKLMGIIFFGRKKTGALYQPAEQSFLNIASGMIAVSLEKSRAYKLAVFDGLTNLYVVRYFRERLKEEIKSPRSLLSGCALIMTDIDHFKKFNDTYGHQQGDAVLKEVARLIKNSLRGNDIAARYGGEEMAVIFPSTDKQTAYDIAERIRKIIERSQFPGLPEGVRVTISLGVASYPQDAQMPEELVKKADEALYRAKHSGRNRTCIA